MLRIDIEEGDFMLDRLHHLENQPHPTSPRDFARDAPPQGTGSTLPLSKGKGDCSLEGRLSTISL